MSALDLDRARETFESSTDFTIGLEEEFAIVNPRDARARAPLRGRLRGLPGRRGARRGGGGRADRLRDRDPLRPRQRPSPMRSPPSRTAATGSSRSSRGWAWRSAPTGTHPWADYLDQRIIDTPHYNRLAEGTGLGRAAQQHLEPPRPHGRSAAPTARSRSATGCASCCRCCSPSRPTRPSSTAATPACRRSAPRSSPAPSRAAASPARSSTGRPTRTSSRMLERTGTAVESTQLWWSVRPHHAFGTVEVRICDAQTRGDEGFALAGLIAACIAQTALDYDEHGYDGAGEPARRPRDRGEPLAGDPPRHGRGDDRLPRRRPSWSRPGRCSSGCSPGPSRPARSWASRSTFPSETGPSGPRRAGPRRLDRGGLPRAVGGDQNDLHRRCQRP